MKEVIKKEEVKKGVAKDAIANINTNYAAEERRQLKEIPNKAVKKVCPICGKSKEYAENKRISCKDCNVLLIVEKDNKEYLASQSGRFAKLNERRK